MASFVLEQKRGGKARQRVAHFFPSRFFLPRKAPMLSAFATSASASPNPSMDYIIFSLTRKRSLGDCFISLSPTGRGRPRRDNSFYTSANEPTERTNFQSPQLFWSSGNSPSIRHPPASGGGGEGGAHSHALRTSLRPFESVLPSIPIPDHPRNTFASGSLSLPLFLTLPLSTSFLRPSLSPSLFPSPFNSATLTNSIL